MAVKTVKPLGKVQFLIFIIQNDGFRLSKTFHLIDSIIISINRFQTKRNYPRILCRNMQLKYGKIKWHPSTKVLTYRHVRIPKLLFLLLIVELFYSIRKIQKNSWSFSLDCYAFLKRSWFVDFLLGYLFLGEDF